LDTSVIVVQSVKGQVIELYTTPLNNYNATAAIYLKATDTVPALTVFEPGLKPAWSPLDFYTLAANSSFPSTTYIMSRVWTTGAGNAFAFSRKLTDTVTGALVSGKLHYYYFY
jgi:hypothetical protein